MTEHNHPLETPKTNAEPEAAEKKAWAPPSLAPLADVRGTAATTTYGNPDGGGAPFSNTFS